MIEKIAHFADVHIHNIKWHNVYDEQFNKTYFKLEEEKPDRILVVGDLFNDFIDISNEAKMLADDFLTRLSEIAPVIIVTGNHDIRKKALTRKNSVKALVKIMRNPRITYYEKSGFYNDDNVVWVNHSHLEKKINPWRDIEHIRDKNKVYIDLFHDPINNCLADNGFKMENKIYRNLSEFKGDIQLFGDIHKFQYLGNKKRAAYCSSLVQQKFSETVDEHGFMIWNLSDFSSKLVDIPNENNLITFEIKEGFDYDNINFEHPLANIKSSFRYVWNDYNANINLENEEKLKKYVKDKWKSTTEIKFKKIRIYTNILSDKIITESLNVQDKTVQQEIFREYLKLNKFEDSFIDDILDIDNLINDKMDYPDTKNNIHWNIEKFWLDNFKSYKYEEIDWKDIHGIIQLHGKNQQGKTTLLDGICYIFQGTTLSTNVLGGGKREKNGDNRYINNKRDLDYCSGGAVINIDGVLYTVVRRTERTWSRNKKSITGASTVVDYYIGTELTEENKLNEEKRDKTQKFIDSVIGDFEDFIRLTLTNSENLNSLLSMDRATFIDSIIRDAGYDIFEKKLKAFKDYKDSLSDERIELNITLAETEIEENTKKINIEISDIKNIKQSIKDVDDEIFNLLSKKENELKKLNKIDNDIASINVEDTNQKIEEYNQTINENKNKLKSNLESIKILKSEYDSIKLEEYYKAIKKIDDDNLNKKLKISQAETQIQTEKNTLLKIDEKVRELKNNEINNQNSLIKDIKNNISNLENEIDVVIENETRKLNDIIKDEQFEIKTIINKLSDIKDKGIVVKKEIKELEEDTVCPTCNREYDEKHKEHRDKKIAEKKKVLEDMMVDVKLLQSKQKEHQNKIDEINTQIEKINLEAFPEDLELSVKNIADKIRNNKKEINNILKIIDEINVENFENTPKLLENINKGLTLKTTTLNRITELTEMIPTIQKEIVQSERDSKGISEKVIVLESEKEEVKKHDNLVQENKELNLKIDNYKLTIENAKNKIDKYYKQLVHIEENKKINIEIEDLNESLNICYDRKELLNDTFNQASQRKTILQGGIDIINTKIEKYKLQCKRDLIFKEYQKCVHRDGIPTYLLQKSKDLFNAELSSLLTDVDFNIFFDEDLNLKMSPSSAPSVIQNALEGSGKERTFAAIALKLALRASNNKSKPNFIFFDEIMTKLIDESVDEFAELLINAKNKIDKIIIIEHVHPIPFDALFEITKDENGVSALAIN